MTYFWLRIIPKRMWFVFFTRLFRRPRRNNTKLPLPSPNRHSSPSPNKRRITSKIQIPLRTRRRSNTRMMALPTMTSRTCSSSAPPLKTKIAMWSHPYRNNLTWTRSLSCLVFWRSRTHSMITATTIWCWILMSRRTRSLLKVITFNLASWTSTPTSWITPTWNLPRTYKTSTANIITTTSPTYSYKSTIPATSTARIWI